MEVDMKRLKRLIPLVGVLVFSISGCTEKMKRSIKDVKSNLTGGLNRKIEVYNYGSKPIKVYEGDIDVEFKKGRLLFELDGRRHIISGGIIIIEEK